MKQKVLSQLHMGATLLITIFIYMYCILQNMGYHGQFNANVQIWSRYVGKQISRPFMVYLFLTNMQNYQIVCNTLHGALDNIKKPSWKNDT